MKRNDFASGQSSQGVTPVVSHAVDQIASRDAHQIPHHDTERGANHARVAIGVGCRRGTSAEQIEAVVRSVLDRLPDAERIGIFTIEDKAGEPGLMEAAERLGLALVVVTREALLEQAPRIRTWSARVERRFGVPSVAEAAALAGGGAAAVLTGPRVADRGVTCAIARVGGWA